MYLKFQLSNSVETVNKGRYTVIEPAEYSDTIILTAADDMYKADVPVDMTIQFPITVSDLLTQSCDIVGITIADNDIVNGNYELTKFSGDIKDYTYRQLIGFLAQIAGGNARINNNNELEILSYSKATANAMYRVGRSNLNIVRTGFPLTIIFDDDPNSFEDLSAILMNGSGTIIESWDLTSENVEITDDNSIIIDTELLTWDNPPYVIELKWLSSYDGVWHAYKMLLLSPNNEDFGYEALTDWSELTVAVDEVEITGIQIELSDLQLPENSEESSKLILVGTDDYVLQIENPFVNSDNAETILTMISYIVGGFKFRPFTGAHIAHPLLEFMDPVFIINKRGTPFPTILTDITFNVLGYTELQNSAEPKLRNGKKYVSTVAQNIITSKQLASNAAKKATNYITEIDNGIFVHPENNSLDGVKIQDTVAIIRNNKEVASYGEIVRIGQAGETRTEIDYHSMKLIDKSGFDYFHFSDLRNSEGNAEIIAQFTGDGTTTDFTLGLAIDSIISVTVNGTATTSYTQPGDYTIRFYSAPAANSAVVITYITTSAWAKAYTLGRRKSNGIIGGFSFAFGSNTEASGYASTAEGQNTVASAMYSRAEGASTIAAGACAHSEGSHTQAQGHYSHSEGNNTKATGYSSHTEGVSTVASEYASHANGYATIAAKVAQTAIGRFNIEDTASGSYGKYAFIIGNGGGDSSRSNAFAVGWDGSLYTKTETANCYITAPLFAGTCFRVGSIVITTMSTNSITAAGTSSGAIPSGYRPTRDIYIVGAGQSSGYAKFMINSSGNVTVTPSKSTSDIYYCTAIWTI